MLILYKMFIKEQCTEQLHRSDRQVTKQWSTSVFALGLFYIPANYINLFFNINLFSYISVPLIACLLLYFVYFSTN